MHFELKLKLCIPKTQVLNLCTSLTKNRCKSVGVYTRTVVAAESADEVDTEASRTTCTTGSSTHFGLLA